jgi:hypothetical protein
MRCMTKLVAVWAVAGAACGSPITAETMVVKGRADGSTWMAVQPTAVDGAATRDKTWTSRGHDQSSSSQVEPEFALTSRASFLAEGTGLEPATGFPPPHFQSYWPYAHQRPNRSKSYSVA